MGSRERDVDQFLGELCSKLGFCSAHRDIQRFVSLLDSEPVVWADEILRMEGLDPQLEKAWRRALRLEVEKRFALWEQRGQRT